MEAGLVVVAIKAEDALSRLGQSIVLSLKYHMGKHIGGERVSGNEQSSTVVKCLRSVEEGLLRIHPFNLLSAVIYTTSLVTSFSAVTCSCCHRSMLLPIAFFLCL